MTDKFGWSPVANGAQFSSIDIPSFPSPLHPLGLEVPPSIPVPTYGRDSPNDSYSVGDEETKSRSGKRQAEGKESLDEKALKRQRRLERNKINSRLNRQRQKKYTQSLEAKVAALEAENRHLKTQVGLTASPKAEVKAEHVAIEPLDEQFQEIINKLKLHLPQLSSTATAETRKFVETFMNEAEQNIACHGKKRLGALHYHLQQIGQLVCPLAFTKFLLWGLHQDETFFDSAAQSGVYPMLQKALDISPSQTIRLQELRPLCQQALEDFDKSLALVKDLHASIARHTASIAELFKILRGTFAVKQQGLFLKWIAENPAMIQLLNTALQLQNDTPSCLLLSTGSICPIPLDEFNAFVIPSNADACTDDSSRSSPSAP